MNLPKYIYFDKLGKSGRPHKKPYRGQFTYNNTKYNCGNFETIKQAQISVDKKLLSLGLQPLLLKSVIICKQNL